MSLSQTVMNEIKPLTAASLYFAAWIGFLMMLKKLVLAEYHIEFYGLSKILVGTLVLAKVVLILEHVSLGTWVQSRPAWVYIVLRTLLYGLGVFVVLVLEKAFEGRQEHGSFAAALRALFHDADMSHVWVNAICVSGALLLYNIIFVIGEHLGPGGLLRVFVSPLSDLRTDKNG